MESDNDAGAVASYIQAGAQYGTHLFWLMLLLLPVTYFCQEMVVRLGVVTQKPLMTSIKEQFGQVWANIAITEHIFVNFLTLLTEYAGITLVMGSVGVNPIVSVTLASLLMIGLVSTGSYNKWEKIMVVLCLLDTIWLFLASRTGVSPLPVNHLPLYDKNYLFLCMALVGTTVAPWQLYFQQSCILDKHIQKKDLVYEQVETFIAAIFTIVVALCMMKIGVIGYNYGWSFTDPSNLATGIGSVFGPFVKNLVKLMVLNASVLGIGAVSLSSAWSYSEYVNKPHSLKMKIKDAPVFYGLYFFSILLAAGLCIIPKFPLELVIVGVQVLAAIMLPMILIFLLLLTGNKEILGEYANKNWNNTINWFIVIGVSLLSLGLVYQGIYPLLVGK